tara:strand:+ start:226 stop:1590 length:1365 start_codon:yes stop_codon:yes gene_type:complete
MKKFPLIFNILLLSPLIIYFYYIFINYDKIYFSFTRIIIFFILPLLFFIINYVFLNFFKKKFLNIIVIQISIIFSFFILEVFLQMLPNIKYYSFINEIKINNNGIINQMSLLDYYSNLKKKDDEIFFPVYSANNQQKLNIDDQSLLALGGIANKKIIYCNEAGIWVNFESDELGFRNPRGIWDKKNIDIFILGDSYGQGTCVENDKMIDHYLRKFYPNTLNLSYSMGGALIQLANLLEYGEIKKPKIVLNLFYSNDIPDTQRENNNIILSNYKNGKKQNLYQFREEINNKLIEKSNQIYKKYLQNKITPTKTSFGKKDFSYMQLLKLTNLRNFAGMPSLFEMKKRLNLDLYFNVIMKNKKITESWKGKFIFIYLPTYQELSGFNFINTSSDLIYEDIINFLKKNNINYLDFREIFIERKLTSDDIYRYNGSHYNELGYEIIGKEIAKYLNGNYE